MFDESTALPIHHHRVHGRVSRSMAGHASGETRVCATLGKIGTKKNTRTDRSFTGGTGRSGNVIGRQLAPTLRPTQRRGLCYRIVEVMISATAHSLLYVASAQRRAWTFIPVDRCQDTERSQSEPKAAAPQRRALPKLSRNTATSQPRRGFSKRRSRRAWKSRQ